ncbi:unnamed protein product, partial [Rotaria magnacalcarata]
MVNRKTSFKAATARGSRKVEESPVEDEESNEDMMDSSDRPSVVKDEVMTTANNKRDKIQSKNASTGTRSGNRTVKTGLDGKYWNDAQSDRRTSPTVINYRQFNGGNASSSSSSVDSSSDETTDTLSKSSSPSSSDDDDNDNNSVLYKKNTFVTCRNASDSFYLCLILQDVYFNTKKIRISWCSIVGEKDDDTPIGINTRFTLDYTDTLDPSTILLSIPDILYHDDNTMSLKNEDITETKRLLEKSIRGESLSSDDMMETEHHQTKKTQSHLRFESTSDTSTSDSESSIAISPQNKKRKRPSNKEKVRKQPVKKRARKTSKNTAATLMASRGAKEGNNALNKDNMSTSQFVNGTEIISYALKNNCSRQIYELLCKHFGNISHSIYDNIHKIIQAGHHKLAASIIDEIKDNMFHGFNYLHHQVLLYDNEDIKINRAASAIKKTRANFMITPIHCAAINPNAKYLKQLLNTMPEYNILDKYERRPIHFAAACEGPEPLEYLLSKQVNFNDVDRGGNSPLHIAVTNGRAINAELLLHTAKEKAAANDAEDQIIDEKFGLASINRMNKSRFYPLHLAVLNNHLNCLKVLLEYGADADACTSTSSGKLTPLMLACQKGYLNIVSHLIDNGAKIEARDRFKRTPLIHACMCGNANVVSYLLRLGANANVFDSSLNTALHYAVAYGWYFCVRLLLEAGADLNCVNSWQTTCLAIGFLKGHYGLCDYLLTDHGVDINFKNEDGLTLVMLTVGLEVSSSAVEQLEYVVTKHNADCTIVDANGSNALHYFAANTTGQNTQYMDEDAKKVLHDNYCKMTAILLANKCDPNQMNNKAQTPLMIALQTKNFILVDYLINKAKIDITSDISNDGKTLLHYFAKQCHKRELIQTLMKLPINDEIKKMGQIFDNDGRTPFHYCSSKFNEFCQRYKSSKGTDKLKQSYESIVKMIKYCLESVECDPDIEIKTADDVKKSTNDGNDEDDDVEDDENEEEEEKEEKEEEEEEEEISSENNEQTDDITPMDNETLDLKLKETSIFFLLRTVSFIDSTMKHPLEFFLEKTKNLNVLHYKTHRTALLEAIHLQQHRTAQMLINHSSCDINLSTSNLLNERLKTPLILACKLQLLPVIHSLLECKQCNVVLCDNNNNQAIHYYLQTSNRTREYLDILNLFIKKLKVTSNRSLNIPGQHQRTPLHIAVYHNLGTIDAITDVEKVLIENGSDLLLKDNLGNIPLHDVFLNKKVGDDPVELCALIMKAMRYKSIDTVNNHGDTPLHLAV